MHFPDKSSALRYLSNISYYRLSAYWYTFLITPKSQHKFSDNSSFDKVIDTYVFDRKLRLLIFDEIERIEISLRTQIIFHFCHQFGNNWYEDPSLFRKSEQFNKFQTKMQNEMKRTSEVFIEHYRNKYTSPANPPAWMVLELASLGQLSALYKNLRNSDSRKKVANHFLLHENVLASWLECISYVRNVCAHHMRLWNRKLPFSPVIPNQTMNVWLRNLPPAQMQNRLYLALSAIMYLLRAFIPNTSFHLKLKNLFESYPAIPLHYMGFPTEWLNEPLWNGNGH